MRIHQSVPLTDVLVGGGVGIGGGCSRSNFLYSCNNRDESLEKVVISDLRLYDYVANFQTKYMRRRSVSSANICLLKG